MAVTFVKTVQAVDPATRRQTIVVLPAQFIQRHARHILEIHQPTLDTLVIVMVPRHDSRQGERYKLVRHHGSAQVSIPRVFLQNVAATADTQLELWESDDYPNRILVRVAGLSTRLAPSSDDFKYVGE